MRLIANCSCLLAQRQSDTLRQVRRSALAFKPNSLYSNRPEDGSALKLTPFPDAERIRGARTDDLTRLLQQPTDRELRPCSNCDTPCGCPTRSTSCCCGCSSQCPDAPGFLSSEPIGHPIDPHMVPLAYALTSLRLVPPCWSCEGHLRAIGGLTRLPQIWFYSASTVYPELIASYLADLRSRWKLLYPWTIAVCPYTPGGATLFQILPEGLQPFELQAEALHSLHNDLQTIGDSLVVSIRQLARNLLAPRS